MTWNPPPRHRLVTLLRSHSCRDCGRNLLAGDVNLRRKRLVPHRGQKWDFVCVDRDDCRSVRELGGEPVWRARWKRQHEATA